MTWGSNVFPLLIVTSGGGFTGLFVYSPAPGPGNLIASIAAQAGTDPFGNAYRAGITSYDPSIDFVQMLNGAIAAGTLSASSLVTNPGGIAFGPDAFTTSSQPGLQVTSPEAGAGLLESQLILFGESNDTTKPAQALFTSSGATPITAALLEVQGGFAIGNTSGEMEIWLIPSGDTTGVKDLAAITAAFVVAASVHLLPGTFYVNGPISPPKGSSLTGAGCIVNNSLRTPAGTTIKAVAAFTGTGVIEWITTAASPIGNTTLRGFHVDLSAAPNTTHGLYAFSNVYGNIIEDISLLGPGGAGTGIGLDMVFDGTSGQPDGWFINNLLIMAMGNGIFAQAADMIWDHIHVIQSVGDGARLRTLANSIISNSRMANGGGNGWNLGDSATGSASPDATIQMVNCNSQINALNGCLIDWPAGGGQMVTLAGYTSVNDGQGGLAAGVAITGGTSASMTVITGLNVAANATGPAFGLDITGASNLTLSSAGLWAIATGTAFNNTSTGVVENRGLIGKLGAGAWAAIADNA